MSREGDKTRGRNGRDFLQHAGSGPKGKSGPGGAPAPTGNGIAMLHSTTSPAALAARLAAPAMEAPAAAAAGRTHRKEGSATAPVAGREAPPRSPSPGPGATGLADVPRKMVADAPSLAASKADIAPIPEARGAGQPDGAAAGPSAEAGPDAGKPRSRSLTPPPTRMQQRSGEGSIRDALERGLAICRRNFVTVAIFSFAINLLLLALPVYLFQVSDRVLTSRSTETLVMLTVVVLGALGIHVLLDTTRRFLLMRVAAGFETTIGGAVLSAATKSAQQGSSREFQALLDLQQLRNFMTGPVLLTMFDAPIAPVYFLAVYIIHPQLGIIVSVAAILLMGVALMNQRVTAVHFARANAYAMRASQQAEAMARNAQTVNAMGMIREGVILWGRETAEALKAQVTAQDRNVIMTSISKMLRLGVQVLMLGWGAYLTLQAELTGGMMIAASIIASRALAPVEGLIEGWRGFVHARSGYTRIKALLQSSPLNQERLILPRPQGRLSVERVLYVPPPTKKVILNGVNFALEPGECLAIVGPSGTGKSTIARMLVGSIVPTSGSVRLDLMDIRNWDPRQFGESVGYLPQDVQLFPGTIKANIARMREDVSDESIFDAAELAGVHEMIAQMPHGYETMIGLDGSPLSGGQKQRIALARAFFGMPRLVVLDEPNSNLDAAGEVALAQAFARARQQQITIVAITQRPSLLSSVDRIMLLEEGRVQLLGRREEVLAKLMPAKGRPAPPTVPVSA